MSSIGQNRLSIYCIIWMKPRLEDSLKYLFIAWHSVERRSLTGANFPCPALDLQLTGDHLDHDHE